MTPAPDGGSGTPDPGRRVAPGGAPPGGAARQVPGRPMPPTRPTSVPLRPAETARRSAPAPAPAGTSRLSRLPGTSAGGTGAGGTGASAVRTRPGTAAGTPPSAAAAAVDPIRVLVIDDSSTVRRMLSGMLGADPRITVVGTAEDGIDGLEQFKTCHPDLVTLDIEMPRMDGLTMLAELRKIDRSVPVIMVSTLTARGGAATLDALSKGASDYVTKPSNTASAADAIGHLKRELVPRIVALGAKHRPRQSGVAPGREPAPVESGTSGTPSRRTSAPSTARPSLLSPTAPSRSDRGPSPRSASRSSPSRRRRADRTRWSASSTSCPPRSACPSSSSSTCPRCSPSSSPSGCTPCTG